MRRREVVLLAGLLAMVAACSFQYGLVYLLPALQDEGLSLAAAGALVSAPIAGTTAGLVLAGAAADRFGERWVLSGGLAGAGLALLAAAGASQTWQRAVLLVLAGALGASAHSTSGRLVLAWFPPHARGRAMGVRQTAQPLGLVLSALLVPRVGGVGGPIAALGTLVLVAAAVAAVAVRDAPRAPAAPSAAGESPYRRSRYLVRVHGASTLLVVPQFTVAAFAFDYLVSVRGWVPGTAGALLAAAQVGGAGARLGAGWWSDRTAARLRPMRLLAALVAAVVGLLAVLVAAEAGAAAVLVVVATTASVSTNGLAYTAVAERAGMSWAGRALGIHNTGQNLVAAASAPLLGALIAAAGAGPGAYALAFGLGALLAAAAVPLLPVRQEAAPAARPAPETVQARRA